MKKGIKAIAGAVCAIVLAVAVLQVKIISIGNGERAVVYILPFGYRPGGSAHADLMDQLVPLYGEEGVQTEKFQGRYQGEEVAVYDTSGYTIQYLGRSVNGGNYLSCEVITARTVLFCGGRGEAIPETRRTLAYIGYDDGDLSSGERAKILWETKTEAYSDSEVYFSSIIPGDD